MPSGLLGIRGANDHSKENAKTPLVDPRAVTSVAQVPEPRVRYEPLHVFAQQRALFSRPSRAPPEHSRPVYQGERCGNRVELRGIEPISDYDGF